MTLVRAFRPALPRVFLPALLAVPAGAEPDHGGGAAETPSASPAGAPVAATGAAAEVAASEDKSPLRTSISLGHSVGAGTFTDDTFRRYLGGSLGIGPSYKITDKVSAGASFSLAWEYTPPDNDAGRRYFPSDVGLSLSHGEIYADDVTGVKLSASLSASLPTSFESRFANRITTMSIGPGLSRAFFGGKFSLRYGFSFAKTFVTSVNPGFTESEGQTIRDQRQALLATCRGEGGACTGGPLNPDYSLSQSFGASLSLTEKLSLGAGLSLAHTFKHAVNDDPDDAVPDEGRTVGRSDSMGGSASLDYGISDTWSAGAEVSSSPGINRTEHRLYFPFSKPYLDNSTQFSLKVAATF